MIDIYDVFGISNDIVSTKNDLERLLKIKFVEHESSYWGIYYLAKLNEDEDIKISNNFIDDDWQEENYKQCEVILRLNNIKDGNKIFNLINNNLLYANHLYRKEINSGVWSKKYIFENGEKKLIWEHYKKK